MSIQGKTVKSINRTQLGKTEKCRYELWNKDDKSIMYCGEPATTITIDGESVSLCPEHMEVLKNAIAIDMQLATMPKIAAPKKSVKPPIVKNTSDNTELEKLIAENTRLKTELEKLTVSHSLIKEEKKYSELAILNACKAVVENKELYKGKHIHGVIWNIGFYGKMSEKQYNFAHKIIEKNELLQPLLN